MKRKSKLILGVDYQINLSGDFRTANPKLALLAFKESQKLNPETTFETNYDAIHRTITYVIKQK